MFINREGSKTPLAPGKFPCTPTVRVKDQRRACLPFLSVFLV